MDQDESRTILGLSELVAKVASIHAEDSDGF